MVALPEAVGREVVCHDGGAVRARAGTGSRCRACRNPARQAGVPRGCHACAKRDRCARRGGARNQAAYAAAVRGL